MNLRKRNKQINYIIEQITDSDEEYNNNDKCDNNNNDINPKFRKIEEEINKHMINYDDVLKMNLPMNDAIWFIEHIRILENMMENTEDHYRVKNMIYERYKMFQSIKNNKLLDKLGNTKNNLIMRIFNSTHNEQNKNIMYDKLNNVNNTEKTEEYHKTVEWIDNILELPTNLKIHNSTDIPTKLIKLKRSLDDNIYGLNLVKEKIIEAYCAMLTNPLYKKKIIGLVGPPGTGKTSIGKSISEAIEQPFSQISFGSIKDPCILTGFPMTYIGSKPGEFFNILKKNKVLNSVVLLDEIDKISGRDGHSISSVLLHILDKTQNHMFKDSYASEISLDLSHIFFILAMNDDNMLDPILKDRLCLIKIDGYTTDEKIIIGKNYLLPKILKDLSFVKNEIVINDNIIEYIINKYCTNDEGVRNLEKLLSTICEKLNVLKNAKNELKLSYSLNIKFPIIITKEHINRLLVDIS